MDNNNISQKEFNRSLKLNLFGGGAFTIWFAVCSPQPIFNVFFTNHLGATSSQLGILIGIVQLSTLFNLLGIIVYGKLKTRKKYFIIMHLIHRLLGVLLAITSFYMARSNDSSMVIKIVFLGAAISNILSSSSSAGWWSWMADLIPDNIRATFFGQRSSISNIVNIIWFMGCSVALDTWTSVNIFVVYGVIFSIASVAGIADMIAFIFVPEPLQKQKEKLSLTNFLEPLANKNFILFSVGVGVTVFAVIVFAPFTAPYITAKDAIAAPNTWLGIMFVISQLTWILVSPSWGLIMDKFGRKPVLMIGCLSAFANLFYFILTSNNYTFILPLIAISSGLLAPALWDGINQMMLSLTPDKNRTAFVAWNMTIVGVISAGGAYFGGMLKDKTEGIDLTIFNSFHVNNIHIILLLSLFLIVIGLLIISSVKENKSKPLKFVVSRVVRPGVFRTFSNMGTLSGTTSSNKIEKTLRAIDGDSDDIALDDILSRLYDPDSEVREEAARALGRIRSLEAVEPLMNEVKDENSTIRSQAALALGKIGAESALPVLFSALDSESEELQTAAVKALGMLGSDESIKNLLNIFKNKSDKLAATGAVAISQLGVLEAVWDIIPKMHCSLNPVLARQLAISIGNLLGKPGEFYKYITGKDSNRTTHIKHLFTDVIKNTEKLISKCSSNSLSAENRKRLVLRFKKIEALLDENKYSECFAMLKISSITIVRTILDKDSSDKEMTYLEHLFPLDQKTGIWWWFTTQAEEYSENSTDEILKIDILIILYYISTFRGKKKD
ncbi:MAG: MFS transporter [Spirochaetaceae bacterium]